MATVNTVCGPISSAELGATLVHEHIIWGAPGWYGDETVAPFERSAVVGKVVGILGQLKMSGGKTIIDATPNDCGRNPEVLKEVSEKSGINIICSTGYYYETAGASYYFQLRRSVGYDITNEMHDLFVREITEGIGRTGVKAGVIKLATGQGEMTEYEKSLFRAAARAQRDTGVAIITHTEQGSLGPEQAAFLLAEGADPKRIQIGHMSDNLGLDYLLQVLSKGVYVAFDRMGLQGVFGCPTDRERYEVLADLIGRGFVSHLLLSHDTALHHLGRPLELPASVRPHCVNWHLTHLFRNVIPALKECGVNDAQINTMIVENPRRLLSGVS